MPLRACRSLKSEHIHSLSRSVLPPNSRRAPTLHQVMSSKRNSDMPAPTDLETIDRPFRRKRKVEAGAVEGAQSGEGPGENSAEKETSEMGEPERPVARGQPLKDFVENWEFRWDVQRDLYPWEWGQGGNLSDGPYNIIRYGQPPPKGWQRRNQT